MKAPNTNAWAQWVFLDGKIVPAREACVSVFDRGFLYGDALFETLRIRHGLPFQWREHLDRLLTGLGTLGFALPLAEEPLRSGALELCQANGLSDGILRVQVSRGPGPRGYSPRNSGPPTVVMTAAPAEPPAASPYGWRLLEEDLRIAGLPLLESCKHANKLPNILARAHADALGADEVLLLNTDGHLVEGSCSNLFWIEKGTLCTPPCSAGALPGITRNFVLRWCADHQVATREVYAFPSVLPASEGVFLTLSTLGVVEGTSLNSQPLPQSPLVQSVYRDWLRALDEETGAARKSGTGQTAS